MSAETIPADVPAVGSVWVKKPNPVTVAASISTGVSYNFDGGSGEATLSRFLQEYEPADRSTRPAEPVAPVAEVKAWLLGDPATGQWIEVDGYRVEYSRGMGTPAHVLASAFQAERARADAAEQRAAVALARVKELEFGAGFEAAFDAVVRPGSRYENWTPDYDPAEIVTDLYNDLEDALARAEKAAEDERDRLYAEIVKPHTGLVVKDGRTGAWEAATRFWLEDKGAMLPADRARLRAYREAQPATDGGDNG